MMRGSLVAAVSALLLLDVTDVWGQEPAMVFEAGHSSLQQWRLPDTPPSPQDNVLTSERAALGKMLFFDPRLSITGQSSCASCHMPERGWSDGFPTSVRLMGAAMTRASPTIVNVGYNSIYLWDGRSPTLEHQALNGISAAGAMNAGSAKPGDGLANIQMLRGYVDAFERAYPAEGVTAKSVARAIASFERTVVSNDSPFDHWVKGDGSALNDQQVRGFALFAGKAGCVACHSSPNFTDNGFHSVGLKSSLEHDADVGRYKQLALVSMKGAFKTPTLRDVEFTAPYFHDGSASTLMQVVEHYATGGERSPSLSPNMKALDLSMQEKEDLVAFLRALSSPRQVFEYPTLPKR